MKSLALKSIGALLLTMFLAATAHLTIIFIVFLSSGNWKVVSPVDFLGVSTIDPSLRDSWHMFYISWGVLAIMFTTALILSFFYKSLFKTFSRAYKAGRQAAQEEINS